MSQGIYLPNGQYLPFPGQEKKEKRVPDLTPYELAQSQAIISSLLQKYANRQLKDCFQALQSDIKGAFEAIGLEVEVHPVFSPDTWEDVQLILDAKKRGYQPLKVEIVGRVEDRVGNHERELYEWKHRKEGKTAFKHTKKGND